MLNLIILNGPHKGEAIAISGDRPTILGRQGDVTLKDSRVSRQHSEVRNEGGTWVITDLGSANGTLVNGKRITKLTELEEGDQIQMGRYLVVVGHMDAIEYEPDAPAMDDSDFGSVSGLAASGAASAVGGVDEDDDDGLPDFDDLMGDDDEDESEKPPVPPARPAPKPQPMAAQLVEDDQDDQMLEDALDAHDSMAASAMAEPDRDGVYDLILEEPADDDEDVDRPEAPPAKAQAKASDAAVAPQVETPEEPEIVEPIAVDEAEESDAIEPIALDEPAEPETVEPVALDEAEEPETIEPMALDEPEEPVIPVSPATEVSEAVVEEDEPQDDALDELASILDEELEDQPEESQAALLAEGKIPPPVEETPDEPIDLEPAPVAVDDVNDFLSEDAPEDEPGDESKPVASLDDSDAPVAPVAAAAVEADDADVLSLDDIEAPPARTGDAPIDLGLDLSGMGTSPVVPESVPESLVAESVVPEESEISSDEVEDDLDALSSAMVSDQDLDAFDALLDEDDLQVDALEPVDDEPTVANIPPIADFGSGVVDDVSESDFDDDAGDDADDEAGLAIGLVGGTGETAGSLSDESSADMALDDDADDDAAPPVVSLVAPIDDDDEVDAGHDDVAERIDDRLPIDLIDDDDDDDEEDQPVSARDASDDSAAEPVALEREEKNWGKTVGLLSALLVLMLGLGVGYYVIYGPGVGVTGSDGDTLALKQPDTPVLPEATSTPASEEPATNSGINPAPGTTSGNPSGPETAPLEPNPDNVPANTSSTPVAEESTTTDGMPAEGAPTSSSAVASSAFASSPSLIGEGALVRSDTASSSSSVRWIEPAAPDLEKMSGAAFEPVTSPTDVVLPTPAEAQPAQPMEDTPMADEGAAGVTPEAGSSDERIEQLTEAIGPPRRVVFLIDASGSLIDTFDQVLERVSGRVGGLLAEQQFTVIFFRRGQVMEVPPLGLKPADGANKRLVADWMSPASGNVSAFGRSEIDRAIALALSYGADEITLYSDNALARSTASGADGLIDQIEELCLAAGEHPVINTVQFVYNDPDNTLRRIAEAFDGQFQFVESAYGKPSNSGGAAAARRQADELSRVPTR